MTGKADTRHPNSDLTIDKKTSVTRNVGIKKIASTTFHTPSRLPDGDEGFRPAVIARATRPTVQAPARLTILSFSSTHGGE